MDKVKMKNTTYVSKSKSKSKEKKTKNDRMPSNNKNAKEPMKKIYGYMKKACKDSNYKPIIFLYLLILIGALLFYYFCF